MKHPKYSHSFEVVSELPEALKDLTKIAYNYRWTWRHETRMLFREMDKVLWEEVEHNPVQLLGRLSRERLDRLANDQGFLANLKIASEELDQYLSCETWFDQAYPGRRKDTQIAYFCAEFGVSEALPIYSGGLGVLAGDHLKAASDLGLPLAAVGLLYSRGYFRQRLTPDGWQQEHYPTYDFYQLPLTLVRGPDQQPLRIEVQLPDRQIICQLWRADVGRIPLYLLDSNIMENAPADQEITDTLYGGDQEMRIRQEMILGIGGMRALWAVGINPTVCHMNEGHSAFLTVERIRQFMQDRGCDFRTARKVVVAGNVFTTHTPVPAGFDLFTPDLLRRYMNSSVEAVGLSHDEFLKLGRIDPHNNNESFNMALLAMENSNHVNGVSKLHADVTQEMFHAKWPDYPEDEVPVEPITNGIHTLTWVCHRMAELFDNYLGTDWRTRPFDPAVWAGVADIPDQELWEIRENQRGDLVRFVRKRLQRDLERRGLSRSEIGSIDQIMDPRVLTLGFARRFATYKRATLLLSDRERLKRMLFHPERPIQLLIAGKSHPKDDGGKKLIQELVNFIGHEGARARVAFLEDYDMQVARAMVQGVDVWLNTPRRPYEASGTSGMKVVPNGGLNCSVLDGWWDEGYKPGVGWAIGERRQYGDPGHQDYMDSRSLYQLLEVEIAPKFYNRVNGEPPKAWVEMIKRSIVQLAHVFSTGRMVAEYATKFYMPASTSYQQLGADNLKRAHDALAWRDRVRAEWPKVRVLKVADNSALQNRVGFEVTITAEVELGSLSPDEVQVDALMGRVGANRELHQIANVELKPASAKGSVHTFSAVLKVANPGHQGYTVRVTPRHADVNVQHELKLVAWEG